MNALSTYPSKKSFLVGFLAGLPVLALILIHWHVFLVPDSWLSLLLASCLGGAFILAAPFSIRVDWGMTVEMTSVPLYLLTVLFTPALAVLVVGIAIWVTHLLSGVSHPNQPPIPVKAIAKWSVLVLLGSVFAHLPLIGSTGHTVLLIGTIGILYLGNVLISCANLIPTHPHAFLTRVADHVRSGGLAEGSQYLLGLLGALLVKDQPWVLLLLVCPTVLIYVALKGVEQEQTSAADLLDSTIHLVEVRDSFTAGHSRRVTNLVARSLAELGISGAEAEQMLLAARVHHRGKFICSQQKTGLAEELDTPKQAQVELDAFCEISA